MSEPTGSAEAAGSEPASVASLELDADHLAVRAIGPWLEAVLERNDRGETASFGAIELAVHELATNSVDHAASPDGRLRLEASCLGDDLVVSVIDHGGAVDLGAIDVPDEPQVRGYGMMIVEQVAAELHYHRDGDVNRWIATFAL